MTTPDIALELEKLRRATEVGFAEINGKIDLLVERGNRTEADVAALESRMTAVERRIWTASGIATVIGAGIPFIVQLAGS